MDVFQMQLLRPAQFLPHIRLLTVTTSRQNPNRQHAIKDAFDFSLERLSCAVLKHTQDLAIQFGLMLLT